jgi:hypothetical protein
MSQSTSTEGRRLEDLWGGGETSWSTRPIPLSDRSGGDFDASTTPPGGLARTRGRRERRPFGSLRLEVFLAALSAAAVSVVMNWDVVRRFGAVIPGRGGEAYAQLWSLGWAGHALRPDAGIPLRTVFDANAFHPTPHSFALADRLFGYGPVTWLFSGPQGLVQAYDLIFVAAPALTWFGAYLLARQLGAHPIGATVAGAGLAYAPWRLGQFEHLDALAIGPIVLALALLARGHGFTMSGRRTPARPLWALLGWLVAAWQLTVGVEADLPFVSLLAVVVGLTVLVSPVRWWRARRARRRRSYAEYVEYVDAQDGAEAGELDGNRRRGRLLMADLLGAAAFAAVGAVMVYPFLRLHANEPRALASAHRSALVDAASPQPMGLLTPPDAGGTWARLVDTHHLVTGSDEVRLLPGVILLELALLGLFVSSWRWWWRAVLAIAGAVFAGLSLGARFPGGYFPGPDSPFALLRRLVPGWVADTTPGLLIIFCTLALAVLGAGAVSRLCGRDAAQGYSGARPRRGPGRSLVLLALLALPVLIVVEGWAPVPTVDTPAVPAALNRAAAPLIVLPTASTTDGRAMYFSAANGKFAALGNGQGPIAPASLLQMRSAMAGFPDAASVDYLRRRGFRSVVVLKDPAAVPVAPPPGTQELGLVSEDFGDSTLWTVVPRS